jgi:hypothetical protein
MMRLELFTKVQILRENTNSTTMHLSSGLMSIRELELELMSLMSDNLSNHIQNKVKALRFW